MGRLTQLCSGIGLLVVFGLVGLTGDAIADIVCNDEHECVINNGLAPPNPDNVIDDGTYEGDTVYVRNTDCPPGWPAVSPDDPCPAPWGEPTEIAIVVGGEVGFLRTYEASTIRKSGGVTASLYAYDTSTVTMSAGFAGVLRAYGTSAVTMSGGEMWELDAHDNSTITMNGGWVFDRLKTNDSSTFTMNGGSVDYNLIALDFSAVTISGGSVYRLTTNGSSTVTISEGTVNSLITYGSSTVTISGGTLGWSLNAHDSSTITMVGRDFAVDGVPIPYGNLTEQTGTLTGTLASGESIDNIFYQGGGSYTGTITLVPEPSTALLYACALTTLALLRRRAA